MMDEFLDTKKSVIITAPAGSGKTEKLARRYIRLMEDGAEPEKILAITFTEKAAAEMKDRVLNILLREAPDTFGRIKEKIPLMRITTIHAFCRKLLTRFALELGLDPSLDVLDTFAASRVWSESIYDTLRTEKDAPGLFFDYLKRKGVKGWGILYGMLEAIHEKRPYSEFLLEERGGPLGAEEASLLELYRKCLDTYRKKKQETGVIDFNDMEIMAYRAISSNPGWLNILYAFDEHTDHILVDEFQDTSSVQWKIIDKITEEWRSGLGAKRAGGKTPTVFLVGDEKQSIYMFRGANVSIFHQVRNTFTEWLGQEAVCLEAKENYRSLPSVIHFVNGLFARAMKSNSPHSWETAYASFKPVREGTGKIELLVLDGEKDSKTTRRKEASLISRKILLIRENLPIPSDPAGSKCRFCDIAVLIRNRTHLAAFENAFREHNIPYVVVGGIGFYDEPEVAVLKEFVSFLADPLDDFSLFSVLRSPLFGLSEPDLSDFLLEGETSLFGKLKHSGVTRIINSVSILDECIAAARSMPLAVVLERFLTQTGGWKIFWEAQRHANLKKFIGIMEEYGSRALSLYEIKEILIRSKKAAESKANVNTENFDAVKIMTVHGAKGLQFPVVFLPSLDDSHSFRTGPILLDETRDSLTFVCEEDPVRRKKNDLFLLRKAKESEEEKRLFYVAVTRAMDHLIMSGVVKRKGGESKIKGKLALIEEAFPGSVSECTPPPGIFDVIHEKELALTDGPRGVIFSRDPDLFREPVYVEPIGQPQGVREWINVTEEDPEVMAKHGQDWIVLGSLCHRLFENISRGITKSEDIEAGIDALIRSDFSLIQKAEHYRGMMRGVLDRLEDSGIMEEIIMPGNNSYTEMPFVLGKGDKVYKGRIDRIIIREGVVYLYDYKTYPVKEEEKKEMKERYRIQMDIYSEACRKLFSLPVKSALLFTYEPEVVFL
jgi:ATP-dependent helicase/nuclease subunit A